LSPDNFDVVGAMNYVSALLDLIAGLADKQREPLSFLGMSIVPGSVAFCVHVDRPEIAWRLADAAGDLVGGRVLAPHGLRTRVARVIDSIAKLPSGVIPVVKVGENKVVIGAPHHDKQARTVEEAELRVRVYRVGGEPARLSAIADVDGAFTASLTHELAEAIANHLYKEIDLVATIERAEDGKIVDAIVHQFHPVEEADSEAQVWRDWFAVAGAGWDDVEDIEAELERGAAIG
jgi:hypothetical protein